MSAGTSLHLQHGKAVWLAGALRTLAFILLLAALGLLAAALTQSLLSVI